jgi:hypothetical protein
MAATADRSGGFAVRRNNTSSENPTVPLKAGRFVPLRMGILIGDTSTWDVCAPDIGAADCRTDGGGAFHSLLWRWVVDTQRARAQSFGGSGGPSAGDIAGGDGTGVGPEACVPRVTDPAGGGIPRSAGNGGCGQYHLGKRVNGAPANRGGKQNTKIHEVKNRSPAASADGECRTHVRGLHGCAQPWNHFGDMEMSGNPFPAGRHLGHPRLPGIDPMGNGPPIQSTASGKACRLVRHAPMDGIRKDSTNDRMTPQGAIDSRGQ